jgi:hypothetical protein
MGQLNELQIKAAQPRDKEYLLADGEGLYLRVRPTGKAWVYRYKEAGKEAKLSLGRYPAMSLAVARKKARAEAERRAGGVEVMYFFLMCDYAKLPLKKLYGGQDGRGAGLYRFCKYCWRTAIPGRLICYEHASMVVDGSAAVPVALAAEAKTPTSRRKQANRQKQDFDTAISNLITKEVMEFHESKFTTDVLLPQSGRDEWLRRRRPRVAQLLIEIGVSVSDDDIIEHLLSLLHDSGTMQGVWRSTYVRVNTTIIQVPELIWPILVRAESWLLVRDQTRKNWGGKRENSGRPKSSSDS